jgi:oligosaccharide repeat unit polymerase
VGILVLAGFALIAVAVRALSGTWFHPAAILAGVWVLTFAVPVFGGLSWTPLVATIISGVMIGALVCASVTVKPREVTVSTPVISGRAASVFVLGGGVAAVASVLLVYRANGVGLGTIFHFGDLLESAADVTVRRYTAKLATPQVATVLLAWTYGAALLAPFVAAGVRGWRGGLLLTAPMLGGAFYALATTAKAGLMIAACITAGGWLMVHALRGGGRPTLRPRVVFRSIVAVVVLAVAFVYFTAVRQGGWTPSNRQHIIDNVITYAGGGVSALGLWLDDPGGRGLGWGSETFAGFAKYLAGDTTLGDAYADIRRVESGTTNVYTILRPLIADFGIGGALLVITLGTLLASHLYRRAVLNQSVGSALLVSAWLGVMLFSLATSILTFTSVCLGLAVAFVLGRRWISLRPEAEWAEPEPQPDERPRPTTRPVRVLSTLRR